MAGEHLDTFVREEMMSKVTVTLEWCKEDVSHDCILAVRDKRNNTDIYMCAMRDENGELIGFCSRHRSRINDEAAPYETID